MNPLSLLGNLVSGVISPVTGYFSKKNENKTRIKLTQIERLKNSDDAVAEWEAINAENNNNTWKDEYVTIVITLPIPTLFFSVVYSTYTGEPEAAIAVQEGIKALKELIPDYGNLLAAVCLAAIGIKALKK